MHRKLIFNEKIDSFNQEFIVKENIFKIENYDIQNNNKISEENPDKDSFKIISRKRRRAEEINLSDLSNSNNTNRNIKLNNFKKKFKYSVIDNNLKPIKYNVKKKQWLNHKLLKIIKKFYSKIIINDINKILLFNKKIKNYRINKISEIKSNIFKIIK